MMKTREVTGFSQCQEQNNMGCHLGNPTLSLPEHSEHVKRGSRYNTDPD